MKDMKELMGTLRDKEQEKAALRDKRRRLREKLEGHRDQDSAEYEAMRGEYYGLDDKIEGVENEIYAIRSEISDKKIEDGLKWKWDAQNATEGERSRVLESGEYRDAFFRSLANRKVSEKDAEIMAYGRRAITDMNGDSVESGAEYLTPKTTYNMIVSVIREYGQVYNAVSKTGFIGDISIPIGTVSGKTENEDGTFTLDFTFTEVRITQEAIVGTVIVKNLLLKNSISALEGYLAGELGKQIAFMLDNGVINGDGGSFAGVLQGAQNKSYTALSYDTIIDVEHSLKRAYSKTAGWIMNWNTFGKFRKIKDTNGNPVGKTDEVVKINGMEYPSIDGKAVMIVDDMIMGDDDFLYGNLASYHCNESQSIVIESDQSPEFKSDKTVFRGKVYAGGQPVLPEENFVFYHLDSDVAATPTASPAAGAVASGTQVTLSSTTAGATIYYTLDGSDPTTKSSKYSANNKPKIVSACTLKAIAVKSGMGNSAVLSAAYTITE